MRVLAVALVAVAFASPAVAAPTHVAFLRGGNLVVLDLAKRTQRIVMRNAGFGPVRWSGDGRLVSSRGRIAGGPTLPASQLVWAPRGERAAYTTTRGGVRVWSPHSTVAAVPDGWGAQTLAWSDDGRLAIGRTVCHVPCGLASHHEVWVWNGQVLRRIVKLSDERGVPMPFAWDARGRVLWWEWPNSSSIAADGVALYANNTKIASMLMYPDWVARCGRTLALAVGGDRNSLHGKSITLAGRDVSRDRTRSWISPSCSPDGSVVVASASRDSQGPWGKEHRSLWQLLPKRRELTRPPAGWSDESPHVLADGSVLFVRTRQTSRKVNGTWIETDRGLLELLRGGRVTKLATLTYSANELSGASLMYYGRYDWERRVAVYG